MRKPVWKRISFELLQHLLAVGIMVAVAGILLNSYIAVESIDGTQVYQLLTMDTSQEFEDSVVYYDLFQNAVSDITQLVVLKEQLESDNIFDPARQIDVTQYAARIGTDEGCQATAVYELDDLIKWGKYGVEYTSRMVSLSDFVHYFGYCLYPENFALDEEGELVFDGFHRVEDPDTDARWKASGQSQPGSDVGVPGKGNGADRDVQAGSSDGTSAENNGAGAGGNGAGTGSTGSDPEDDRDGVQGDSSGKSEEELALIAEHMGKYTEEQLEDQFVFSYIMAQGLKGINVSMEDDGTMVYFSLLNSRYETVDGKKRLPDMVDNWVDYIRLQDNVVSAIENLTLNYERYRVCNETYREGKSNVAYMVRMTTEEGMRTYTNVSKLQERTDEEVTEFFSEYRRYLIYYPDSLMFVGNTILSEDEIYKYINLYDYAYPDTTYIWMGVDMNYSVEGDAFYNANAVYERIVPHVGRILAVIALLVLLWLGIVLYLTVTAGMVQEEEGQRVWYLNRFDHIWTEVLVLLGILFGWGGVWGYHRILDIAATAGVVPAEVMGIQLTGFYHYGIFGIYGMYVSLSASIVWYSLVRRLKVGNLWTDSFVYKACQGMHNVVLFIFRHRNSVISTLVPYNLFLFVNLAGLVTAYQIQEKSLALMAVLFGLVLFNGIIGVLVFRKNAERTEVEEGIRRIRDGEVEYKVDLSSMHGANRELADAVNNIGEGILKAVQTSMKDEQMKTDLITNVSHDIKTPLTSIINYVDLLKRLKIEEEPARGYIAILDAKAQRLKQLTDDLVEASKISSGNIELEQEKLNLTELLKQGIGEFSEKLEESGLQVVFEKEDTSAYIYADSRRMWRVVENLFHNICKYAMEGTRVYIDIEIQEGQVCACVKNISRQQMSIQPEELTERFIRGDSSRTTEGSGLGLSIAKSLIQVQGGTFQILLDGDLFKVEFSFPEWHGEEGLLQEPGDP